MLILFLIRSMPDLKKYLLSGLPSSPFHFIPWKFRNASILFQEPTTSVGCKVANKSTYYKGPATVLHKSHFPCLAGFQINFEPVFKSIVHIRHCIH